MASGMSAEVEQMIHSLEARYVKQRDELTKVTAQRDELMATNTTMEQTLGEEQRQLRAARAQAAQHEATALDQKRYLTRTQTELSAAQEVSYYNVCVRQTAPYLSLLSTAAAAAAAAAQTVRALTLTLAPQTPPPPRHAPTLFLPPRRKWPA